MTATELDEDVAQICLLAGASTTATRAGAPGEFPPRPRRRPARHLRGLGPEDAAPRRAQRRSAAELLRRLERPLLAKVYRWTGHFPERTRVLLRHLAERAEHAEARSTRADARVPASWR